MRFLRFAPLDGARFAAGFARCGWVLPFLACLVFPVFKQIFGRGCKFRSENLGFFGRASSEGKKHIAPPAHLSNTTGSWTFLQEVKELAQMLA